MQGIHEGCCAFVVGCAVHRSRKKTPAQRGKKTFGTLKNKAHTHQTLQGLGMVIVPTGLLNSTVGVVRRLVVVHGHQVHLIVVIQSSRRGSKCRRRLRLLRHLGPSATARPASAGRLGNRICRRRRRRRVVPRRRRRLHLGLDCRRLVAGRRRRMHLRHVRRCGRRPRVLLGLDCRRIVADRRRRMHLGHGRRCGRRSRVRRQGGGRSRRAQRHRWRGRGQAHASRRHRLARVHLAEGNQFGGVVDLCGIEKRHSCTLRRFPRQRQQSVRAVLECPRRADVLTHLPLGRLGTART